MPGLVGDPWRIAPYNSGSEASISEKKYSEEVLAPYPVGKVVFSTPSPTLEELILRRLEKLENVVERMRVALDA